MKNRWIHRMIDLVWRDADAPQETAFILSTDRDVYPCPFWSCLHR